MIFFGLPSVGIVVPAFPSAIIAFSLNVGAYASETLRGAILAVPKGQIEAGLTTNLNYLTIMRLIVLPQAFRSAFPALFNTFISLVKDTSLAANITVAEMFMAAQRIVATTYEPLVLYCEVGLIYLAFCTVLTWLQGICDSQLAKRFCFCRIGRSPIDGNDIEAADRLISCFRVGRVDTLMGRVLDSLVVSLPICL